MRDYQINKQLAVAILSMNSDFSCYDGMNKIDHQSWIEKAENSLPNSLPLANLCTKPCEYAATLCANAPSIFVDFLIPIINFRLSIDEIGLLLRFIRHIMQKTFSSEKVFLVEHTGFDT